MTGVMDNRICKAHSMKGAEVLFEVVKGELEVVVGVKKSQVVSPCHA